MSDANATLIRNQDIVHGSAAAALTALLWDCVITFDDEVRYIWKKPNTSWIKWSFIFTRAYALSYLTFSFIPMPCRTFGIWGVASIQVILASVDILLVMRVYALYRKSRIVLRFLIACYVAVNAIMTYTLVRTVPKLQFSAVCDLTHTPSSLLIFGFASIGFELLLFGMTMYRFICTIREGAGRSGIITVLARDGALWFALILTIIVVNAACLLLLTNALNTIALPWIFTFSAVAGSRLVLNLQVDRHVEFSQSSSGSSSGRKPPMPIAFARGATPADTSRSTAVSTFHASRGTSDNIDDDRIPVLDILPEPDRLGDGEWSPPPPSADIELQDRFVRTTNFP